MKIKGMNKHSKIKRHDPTKVKWEQRVQASIFAAGTTATSPASMLERLTRCASAAMSRSVTHAAMRSQGATRA